MCNVNYLFLNILQVINGYYTFSIHLKEPNNIKKMCKKRGV